MDIKGLRTLNLIGTILFAIIGSIMVLVYTMWVNIIFNRTILTSTASDSGYNTCVVLIFIWFSILFIFESLLYKYTVIALDLGNYKQAKRWTLVGIIVGFAGGIVPLIIFIISYVSFDEAIRNQPKVHQYPSGNRYCNRCGKKIPFDSKLCPYCGLKQLPFPKN